MLGCHLTQLVMAALEAAIQPIRATAVGCRDWMAGSSPAMTNWESARTSV